jgi:hypothetical protein
MKLKNLSIMSLCLFSICFYNGLVAEAKSNSKEVTTEEQKIQSKDSRLQKIWKSAKKNFESLKSNLSINKVGNTLMANKKTALVGAVALIAGGAVEYKLQLLEKATQYAEESKNSFMKYFQTKATEGDVKTEGDLAAKGNIK